MPSRSPEWFKSSYSQQNGECLEALHTPRGLTLRDSTRPEGTRISFATEAWTTFLASVTSIRTESPAP
ncbi:DUF397 domain-containing protein [Streptomyces sp. NPDC058284]|uniref:DUF397 domain-containing protein n=1 Tax=unclassified Streptomyces TaxID=2593676 RepID=UPI0036476E7F